MATSPTVEFPTARMRGRTGRRLHDVDRLQPDGPGEWRMKKPRVLAGFRDSAGPSWTVLEGIAQRLSRMVGAGAKCTSPGQPVPAGAHSPDPRRKRWRLRDVADARAPGV